MNYHIARNGQQYGQFPESEIRSRLANGSLLAGDLCWTEGMNEWQQVGQIFPAAAPQGQAFPAPQAQIFPASPYAPANPYAPPSADIRTSFNRLPLAGLGQRFGAAMLDSLIAVVLCIPLFIGAVMTDDQRPGAAMPPLALALMGISGVMLLGLLVYNIYLLSTKGQTLGKKILGIRVVNDLDDSNAGFVRAFLLRVVVNAIPGAIIPFYSLVDICLIFGNDRRCIHDYIAGTRVVEG